MSWLPLALLWALLPGAVAPQEPMPDSALEARTRQVAAELRCPVCQGLSIQDSPSELAREMRAVVRDQLAAGRTPAQVRAYFVSKYGEWILLQPQPQGFNLLIYLLPAAALLGGGTVLVLALRRWTRPQVQTAAAGEPRAPAMPGR
ncbi:MAG: cytochrome c-type biogenesis protein CcmH [Gemmatimonadetes bacterium]|nr:cytochrome c-type biogenesis protein CcmH [Gemmatimonadota bacterium]